jgi:hypothetical protein
MFESLRIASRSAALTLIAALLACVPFSLTSAATASHGDIVVVTVHGTVSATMAGMTVPLSAGAILQLPATVRTGADGAVELRQGPSTFAAAGNTELEIPQSAAQDGLVERIIQIRGNAFYSIGKRTGTRLRVEAPYLVAVIKGTQFNVAAQEDSTTIALFEGHLEVRASDDSDVVALEAGEIAIRRRDDVSISVLRLNAARGDTRRNPELAARQQADSANSNTSAVVARSDNTAQPRVDATTTIDNAAGSGVVTAPERGRIVDAIADTTTNVSARTAIEVDVRDSSPVAANVDVDAKVGGVSADVGASTAVNASAGTVDVGVSGAVAATSAVTVDTAWAQLPTFRPAPVNVDAGASVAAAGLPVDASAGASVDVPAGTANVGLDTSVASTDVGATVGVDAGTGNVGTDVGVAGVNVGVDAGTSGVSLDVGTSNDSGGGLLGGLGGPAGRSQA